HPAFGTPLPRGRERGRGRGRVPQPTALRRGLRYVAPSELTYAGNFSYRTLVYTAPGRATTKVFRAMKLCFASGRQTPSGLRVAHGTPCRFLQWRAEATDSGDEQRS